MALIPSSAPCAVLDLFMQKKGGAVVGVGSEACAARRAPTAMGATARPT